VKIKATVLSQSFKGLKALRVAQLSRNLPSVQIET